MLLSIEVVPKSPEEKFMNRYNEWQAWRSTKFVILQCWDTSSVIQETASIKKAGSAVVVNTTLGHKISFGAVVEGICTALKIHPMYLEEPINRTGNLTKTEAFWNEKSAKLFTVFNDNLCNVLSDCLNANPAFDTALVAQSKNSRTKVSSTLEEMPSFKAMSRKVATITNLSKNKDNKMGATQSLSTARGTLLQLFRYCFLSKAGLHALSRICTYIDSPGQRCSDSLDYNWNRMLDLPYFMNVLGRVHVAFVNFMKAKIAEETKLLTVLRQKDVLQRHGDRILSVLEGAQDPDIPGYMIDIKGLLLVDSYRGQAIVNRLVFAIGNEFITDLLSSRCDFGVDPPFRNSKNPEANLYLKLFVGYVLCWILSNLKFRIGSSSHFLFPFQYSKHGTDMKFFPTGEGGKGEIKCTTETIMLLFPLYLDYLAEKDHHVMLKERKMSLMILKDLIGDPTWYRKEMNGENSDKDDTSKRGGFDINKTVIIGCKDIVENAEHTWIPSKYKFSMFLEEVLTDSFDTDQLREFPRSIYNQLGKSDREKMDKKMNAKFGYPFVEAEDAKEEADEESAENNDDETETSQTLPDNPVTPPTKNTTKTESASAGNTDDIVPVRRSVRKTVSAVDDAKDDKDEATSDKTSESSNGLKKSSSKLVSRTKPKTKHAKLKEDVERFIKDPDAMTENKGKILKLLFKAAARVAEDRGDEVDVNFLKSISLDKSVLQNFVGYKWLTAGIKEIIETDENLTTSTIAKPNAKSTTDDTVDSSSTLSSKEGNDDDDDEADIDSTSDDDDDLEVASETPKKRKAATKANATKNTKRQKKGTQVSSHSQSTAKAGRKNK